jgi:hypothetical protein
MLMEDPRRLPRYDLSHHETRPEDNLSHGCREQRIGLSCMLDELHEVSVHDIVAVAVRRNILRTSLAEKKRESKPAHGHYLGGVDAGFLRADELKDLPPKDLFHQYYLMAD